MSNADYITGAGATDQGFPDLVYNLAADGYLVAYEWQSWTPGSDGGIYGRRWVPSVVFLPLVVRNK